MACGPCNLCKTCDLTQPCKHEDVARPSMEACGIDVYATLAKSGYRLKVVKTPEEACHFCALVLVDWLGRADGLPEGTVSLRLVFENVFKESKNPNKFP
jgi:hypothetical protein